MTNKKENVIVAKIKRSNPVAGMEPRLETFEVKVEGRISVLNLLRQIYQDLDPTLAFRNYDCYRGVCSACLMDIDGKKARACSVWVDPGAELLIEPLSGHKVIRDLVVDNGESSCELI